MGLTYEELQIGMEVGRAEFTVTDEIIDEYADAVEYAHSLFTKDSPEGVRIAHPDLVPKYCKRLLWTGVLGPNIRAAQEFKFINPIPVGTRVTAVGRVADKYEKRGKKFVVFEAVFEGEDGKPFLVDRRTQMLLPPPGSLELKR